MSTRAVTVMPARSGVWPSGAESRLMSTGTRCTTFTQLPLEFCAGRSANSALVAGAMVLTRPRHVASGIGVGDDGDFLALRACG